MAPGLLPQEHTRRHRDHARRGPPRAAAPVLAVCGLLAAVELPADEPVRVAASAWVGDTPTRVIEALGLLADEGPPVVFEYEDAGSAALERLLAGEAQFALAGNAPVAAALLRRETEDPAGDPVVLASLGLSTPEYLVIGNGELGVGRPRDLAGRRVGLNAGSSSHYGWSRFAAYHGLDETAVTMVDLPVGALRDALLSGEVDAVVSWNPWSGPLIDELGDAATVMSTGTIYTVNWLLLTRRELADNRPELMDRVLSAYLQAIDLAAAEPEEVRLVHASAMDLSPAEVAETGLEAIWNPAMNWALLANMENALGWLSGFPEYAGSRLPAPAEYLDARALQRVAPDNLVLPPYLLRLPGDRTDSGR